MIWLILLVLFVLIIGICLIIIIVDRRLSSLSRGTSDQAIIEWLKSTQASVNSTQKSVDEVIRATSVNIGKTLQENTRQLNERLDRASLVIKEVSQEISQMSEIGRGMRELQDFLKNPKLRGNIGEQVLKDLIAQMFPKNSFHLQYQFKSGERVDAAIKTDAGILPIDSKFPLENYQKMSKAGSQSEKLVAQKEFARDIKRHIDQISKKYILPGEGTLDFALMYIPSESVFYEVIGMPELVDYARGSRVYPVSPSTLYAHLELILLSFEGKKFQNQSYEILKLLRSIQTDTAKVQENIDLLGRHINNASSQFHNVASGFDVLTRKISNARYIESDRKGLTAEEKIEKE